MLEEHPVELYAGKPSGAPPVLRTVVGKKQIGRHKHMSQTVHRIEHGAMPCALTLFALSRRRPCGERSEIWPW